MPQEIILDGNRPGVFSRNNIIYYGLRGELGHYFDDIFLHTLESIYFPNKGGNDNKNYNIYFRSTEFRQAFHQQLRELNSTRYNSDRPLYLGLTDNEKERHEERDPVTNYSFGKVKIKILIPERDEIIRNFNTIFNNSQENIQFPTDDNNFNKLVIVGNDLSDSESKQFSHIDSFQNAANTWKGYKQIYNQIRKGNRKVVTSGRQAINLINSNATTAKPATEIFFSTHGAFYAIDFNKTRSNIYQSINHMSILQNEKDWKPEPEAAFIYHDFQSLLYNNKIAPNITITLGGCYNAGRLEEADEAITRTDLSIDEKNRIRRWKNLNSNFGLRPQNFAYVLSIVLPKATIIASYEQVTPRNGLEYPVMYQNGLRWIFTVPANRRNKLETTGLKGGINSTLYPLIFEKIK